MDFSLNTPSHFFPRPLDNYVQLHITIEYQQAAVSSKASQQPIRNWFKLHSNTAALQTKLIKQNLVFSKFKTKYVQVVD
jgi:hypothetical protein